MVIKISSVSLGFLEYKLVAKTLRSGQLAQGENVAQFERMFANFIDHKVDHCVAVNSGTSGLYVALLTLGVGEGDEVILPSFSFAATANAVKLVGAVPVFCDIDKNTYTISTSEIKNKITKKTKCIIPVHIFGLPADLPKIYQIALENDLLVIEDAAQAHGAEIEGRKIGWAADAVVYSFYPTKNITSVEGGIIAFKDGGAADFARLFRNQGMRQRYVHEIIGMNLRMSDVHASIGIAQMSKIQSFMRLRKKNANYYDEHLSNYYERQLVPTGFMHVFHQYTIRIRTDRDTVKTYLAEKGIETAIYYPTPIHELLPYRTGELLFETDMLCKEILAIPVHNKLKSFEVKKVVKILNELVT
jgi:dTDP-4-amino-4,6-dideoxygalactose transaminase